MKSLVVLIGLFAVCSAILKCHDFTSGKRTEDNNNIAVKTSPDKVCNSNKWCVSVTGKFELKDDRSNSQKRTDSGNRNKRDDDGGDSAGAGGDGGGRGDKGGGDDAMAAGADAVARADASPSRSGMGGGGLGDGGETPKYFGFVGEVHNCVDDVDQAKCDDIGDTCKTFDNGLDSPFKDIKTKTDKTTVCCCKKALCNDKSSGVMVSVTLALTFVCLLIALFH